MKNCFQVVFDWEKERSNRDVCYGKKMEGDFDFCNQPDNQKNKIRFNIKTKTIFRFLHN